ncbi:MAG TPA: UDP-4-amino-4,6-dideoxy-N-acetyl-beta-L-altrosamine transaminase [Alphaproteobacteria bacterium]|jgi:UDP-4-amino-4,6-dideoxy-N-acetyl-beta-L-altrosamine transaminase
MIPYGRQLIEEDDIRAVVEVLRGDWLTTGPAVAAFEAAFAEAVGGAHAVSCANGTAALHLAALALGLGPGDRVIVPSLTFLATASAPRFTGAEIVFADVDADSGLLTPATLEAAIARVPRAERETLKAVFPVHLGGQLCDMPALRALCAEHGLAVVEDACHALGAEYGDGVRVGGAANLATFSFHPVKTITSGEGGMVTTGDARLAARLRRLRSHGMIRDAAAFSERAAAFDAGGAANPWYYEMPEPGLNYRLTDIQAALGHSQLRKLARFVARRDALMARYAERLAPLAPVVRLAGRAKAGRPAWHLCSVRIDFTALGTDRASLMRRLRERGIGTQVHYIPVHRQPYYSQRYGALRLPGAEDYYRRALSLPLYAAMAPADVDTVVDALAEIVTPANRLRAAP